MKRRILYFWPDTGWLLIRLRKDGGTVLRFTPSPKVIVEGLHRAAQSVPGKFPDKKGKQPKAE